MGCVTRLQVLRGTTVNRLGMVPLEGEMLYDTTEKKLYVGDGTTPGGVDPMLSDQLTETVEDIVDGIFQTIQSDSITIVYDDLNNILSLEVNVAGIDHQLLMGAGAYGHDVIDMHLVDTNNPHFVTKAQVGLGNADNTSDMDKPISTATQNALDFKADKTITISAGAGLTGGGDLSANRTIAMPNVGTAGTYGAANRWNQIITDAQGRVTSIVSNLISIVATQVSDFADAVRSTILTGLTFPYYAKVVATDSILTAIGKLQGQLNVWVDKVVGTDVSSSSNSVLSTLNDLQFDVVAGRRYYINAVLMFTSTQAGTGIATTITNLGGATGIISLLARMATGLDGTNTEHVGSISSFGDLVTSPGVEAVGVETLCTIEGVFVATASGSLALQFRSENNGQTITVKGGSCLFAREFQ